MLIFRKTEETEIINFEGSKSSRYQIRLNRVEEIGQSIKTESKVFR